MNNDHSFNGRDAVESALRLERITPDRAQATADYVVTTLNLADRLADNGHEFESQSLAIRDQPTLDIAPMFKSSAVGYLLSTTMLPTINQSNQQIAGIYELAGSPHNTRGPIESWLLFCEFFQTSMKTSLATRPANISRSDMPSQYRGCTDQIKGRPALDGQVPSLPQLEAKSLRPNESHLARRKNNPGFDTYVIIASDAPKTYAHLVQLHTVYYPVINKVSGEVMSTDLQDVSFIRYKGQRVTQMPIPQVLVDGNPIEGVSHLVGKGGVCTSHGLVETLTLNQNPTTSRTYLDPNHKSVSLGKAGYVDLKQLGVIEP